jgi:hypothetical protein
MHAIYPKQLIPELAVDPASPEAGEMWIKTAALLSRQSSPTMATI